MCFFLGTYIPNTHTIIPQTDFTCNIFTQKLQQKFAKCYLLWQIYADGLCSGFYSGNSRTVFFAFRSCLFLRAVWDAVTCDDGCYVRGAGYADGEGYVITGLVDASR